MSKSSSIRHLWDVCVPMRDGLRLSADIYLPPEEVEGPYPTILQRTPYDNTMELWVKIATFFAEHGYAFVSQDVRGRHDSEGEWYPFFNEGPDGYDTVEWIAEQPWSNGRIGTMGGSYGGWFQWALACKRPPHLVTMVSTAAGGRFMQELPFVNGAVSLWTLAWLHLVGGRTLQRGTNPVVNWKEVFYHLPLKTMDQALGRTNTVWREWLSHPDLDDFWKRFRLDDDFEHIDLPVLHITGWYDGDQPGALYFYEGMVNHSPAADRQFILIGPWDHAGTRTPKQELGGLNFTPAAIVDMNKLHLRWFDYWLKGVDNGLLNDKRVRIFVMGDNKWRDEEDWPPKRAQMREFYLHSGGRANTLKGDGHLSTKAPATEPPDEYTYNPENPVEVVTDWNLYGDTEEPLDKRFIERRDDVLVYTSEPLKEELEVCGRPFVTLYASSDCPDTDWVAMLSDVYPDGRSINLGQGVLRARYRNSLGEAELMIPGKVYKFTFELMSTCILFKPDHRIRLSITSSAFPTYDRNPNTGHPIGEDAELRIAHHTIYHDNEYPSHILLPVVPSPQNRQHPG